MAQAHCSRCRQGWDWSGWPSCHPGLQPARPSLNTQWSERRNKTERAQYPDSKTPWPNVSTNHILGFSPCRCQGPLRAHNPLSPPPVLRKQARLNRTRRVSKLSSCPWGRRWAVFGAAALESQPSFRSLQVPPALSWRPQTATPTQGGRYQQPRTRQR